MARLKLKNYRPLFKRALIACIVFPPVVALTNNSGDQKVEKKPTAAESQCDAKKSANSKAAPKRVDSSNQKNPCAQ